MKKLLILLLCIVATFSFFGCNSTKSIEKNPVEYADSNHDVKKFPEFKTVDLEGKETTHEIFSQNKLTVVNLWATS